MNLEIDQNERYYLKIVRQRNSSKTALNRISWNIWRTLCVDMHFYRNFFKEQFISILNFGQNYFVQLRWNWFSVRLPVTNAWNCHSLGHIWKKNCFPSPGSRFWNWPGSQVIFFFFWENGKMQIHGLTNLWKCGSGHG